MTPPEPRAAPGALARLSAEATRHGAQLGFGRSLVVSGAVHAAAIGATLLVAYGIAPGDGGKAPPSRLVFAEAPSEPVWRLAEPEHEPPDVESPEAPRPELQPVEEELPPEPFPPDQALAPALLSEVPWTRVGSEPLADLRKQARERERQRALAAARAAVRPAASAPAAAPAAPRGEDRALRLVDSVRPPYPRISLRLQEQGVVLVRLHVGADGHVTRVELLESSGHERLDRAAVETLRSWRFDPALEDGRAVADTYDHRVVFVIE